MKEFIVYQKLSISKKFKFCWVHNNAARVWQFCLLKSKLTFAVKEWWAGGFQANGQIAVKRDET